MCPMCPRNLPSLWPALVFAQVRAKVAAVVLAKLAMAAQTAASEEQGTMLVGNPEDSSFLTQPAWRRSLELEVLHSTTTLATYATHVSSAEAVLQSQAGHW